MQATIRVVVPRDPTKGVKVEVEGHPGPSCQNLTEGIEKALGKTTSTELKDDYYRNQLAENQQLQ